MIEGERRQVQLERVVRGERIKMKQTNNKLTVSYSMTLRAWVIYEENGGFHSTQRSKAINSAEKAHTLAKQWQEDLEKGIFPNYDL